ncbi:MAG TPA: L-aspartate oxidase [Vicinamibacterales bacterium]|nr:L-aspartate oxidase [Vicinamibacterales bacterium]
MERRADFLIIGSGIAGLRAAAELGGSGRVLIVTKADPREGNTGYAQGGIAAAVGPDDSPARHASDTIAAGDGLCDPRAVQVLAEEGPQYVRELLDWGVGFDRTDDGEPALAIEGAHSARRVLHARDATGREIARLLWSRVSALPEVTTCDHARVIDLIVEDGRCVGVRFLLDDGTIESARAQAVLLATGGAGQVYSETTNPPVATGDGVAVAYRAGARVADMEFVQFHPTALKVPGQPRFLLSEALRGEGAVLLNDRGERFMLRRDPAGDLAPRDRVARGIVREAEETGRPIYLSLAHLDPAFVHRRFPLISAACRQADLDLASDRIPVGPAAHYIMGGVVTDLDGRTTVPGLFAAGEVACTGVHGANRLASNSLLEGLVFGARAGRAMKASGVERTGGEATAARSPSGLAAPIGLPAVEAVQALMWTNVGLFRDRAGLETALAVLDPAWRALDDRLRAGGPPHPAEWRAASVLTVGWLIARAALRRHESRGAHYRTDYPVRDDIHWNRRVAESRGDRGEGR